MGSLCSLKEQLLFFIFEIISFACPTLLFQHVHRDTEAWGIRKTGKFSGSQEKYIQIFFPVRMSEMCYDSIGSNGLHLSLPLIFVVFANVFVVN